MRVLPSPEAIGDDIAKRLLALMGQARDAGRHFLLGCPTGRTPKPIFAAMAQHVAHTKQDLSHVVLVLMDEYLVEGSRGLEYAPAAQPWSCHDFARAEIADRLNAGLPEERQVPEGAIWFPDPRDPGGYEKRITESGGIDYFILASGASDGHVAFNQPGSARDSRTRIIPLSEGTRRDNFATFPVFGSLDNVPHHGVSVGIATIAESRAAAMVVWGAGKRETLARMRRASQYDPAWPATLIHEIAAGEIVSDAEAAGSAS